jgi:hypothetical protein
MHMHVRKTTSQLIHPPSSVEKKKPFSGICYPPRRQKSRPMTYPIPYLLVLCLVPYFPLQIMSLCGEQHQSACY